ncbi:uncharacterized protein B0T15DRAFT_516438 [Chaetomium strumarium]|uniref:Uncharacterized protein n=1 Tax=Chaetomium strumarium TaxID=1170767 RepID=A0AAJ0M5P9_9PEZI|nr:hypothetical protein B0T15DRAFT_516438 [Chaetomium strumarium]
METEELDAEVLKKYILGGHVETLADDDEERYRSQFVKYIEGGKRGLVRHGPEG